jgi:hypothetical protein
MHVQAAHAARQEGPCCRPAGTNNRRSRNVDNPRRAMCSGSSQGVELMTADDDIYVVDRDVPWVSLG